MTHLVEWAESIERSSRQTCEPEATELRRVAAALRKLAADDIQRTNQRAGERL